MAIGRAVPLNPPLVKESNIRLPSVRRPRSPAFVIAVVSLFVMLSAPSALTANGDNLRTIIADRTGTDCASVDAAGNHFSVGVGLAFDGTDLLVSC